MGYIKQLSDDLIKKIAAGEIIERPASVVKELVENSIDAGASRIEIEIERGGKYIKVADNGNGIDPDDIPLLFTRYATSKITKIDDLWDVNSFGFRGEALASISSVSKITCNSKHKDQETGFEIKVENGKINKKSSGISVGTVFEIDDLFYNVPARGKFLKSTQTELGHISDVVIALALSKPEVAFKLIHNKSVILETSGSADLEQVVTELLGKDLKSHLIPVTAGNNILELSGFVSTLEVYRSNRKNLFVFVNLRPIKCQIINKAIQSAYEGLIPQGRFPVVVLNLKFKPKFVDVNVHPAKKEVRYTNSTDVYNLVLQTIQNTISGHYKKKYKKEALYSFNEPKNHEPRNHELQNKSYSQAAFDLYTDNRQQTTDNRQQTTDNRQQTADNRQQTTDNRQQTQISNEIALPSACNDNSTLDRLFAVNNLKCNIVYSDKPIANMTKIGNKTIFEVGTIFDDNVQIVFSGEIVGESEYQKEYFNRLSELGGAVYKLYLSTKSGIQGKIVDCGVDEVNKKSQRKKPQTKILYEVWERDHWTCVYCGKKLIDPEAAKLAIKEAQNAFVTYINKEGKKVTNHLIHEHTASYDHYLPASKLPQFNMDKENLYASCIECNRKKSDSMSSNSWVPNSRNSWEKPFEIAGLCFSSPKTYELSSGGVPLGTS